MKETKRKKSFKIRESRNEKLERGIFFLLSSKCYVCLSVCLSVCIVPQIVGCKFVSTFLLLFSCIKSCIDDLEYFLGTKIENSYFELNLMF